MDKKTFLEELKSSLSVLQEAELDDIMDEYEQHIDMKVQSGLTEEEAIADFGNLRELTAEILEAYHVRADYDASGKGPAGQETASGKQRWSDCWSSFRDQCRVFAAFADKKCKAAGAWIKNLLKLDISKRERPEGEEADTDQAESRNIPVHGIRRLTAFGGRMWTEFWRLAGRMLYGCLRLIRWCVVRGAALVCWTVTHAWTLLGVCVRVCWNLGWIGFSLFCGLMGLFCLFGFGVLLVLLLQGYPLAGVTVGMLGLNLCLFAAAGLEWTFLWRKRAAAAAGEIKLIGEEAEQHA